MRDLWQTPKSIIKLGFEHSRVVMMNEAHHYLQRCVRTRKVGKDIILQAHNLGVRYLAMEVLTKADVLINQTHRVTSIDNEMLMQPDMRDMVQMAVDLGWQIMAYDSDTRDYLHSHNLNAYETYSPQEWQEIVCTNVFWEWRELTAGQTLADQFLQLSDDQKLLVWVGWQHHSRNPIVMFEEAKQITMGCVFEELTKVNYFSIDQTTTILDDPDLEQWRQYAEKHAKVLTSLGGTAGFMRENLPIELKPLSDLHAHDAYLLSIENDMI